MLSLPGFNNNGKVNGKTLYDKIVSTSLHEGLSFSELVYYGKSNYNDLFSTFKSMHTDSIKEQTEKYEFLRIFRRVLQRETLPDMDIKALTESSKPLQHHLDTELQARLRHQVQQPEKPLRSPTYTVKPQSTPKYHTVKSHK